LNFGYGGPVRIIEEKKSNISLSLFNLRKSVPSEFACLPRSLDGLEYWKATEFREILLYTGVIVLKSNLKEEFYEHFLLLVVSIRILYSNQISNENNNLALKLLRQFVEIDSSHYGPQFINYNVHSLIHLPFYAHLHGPLDNLSAFKYENYLQILKKSMKCCRYPLSEIQNKITASEGEELIPVSTYDENILIKSFKINENISNFGTIYYIDLHQFPKNSTCPHILKIHSETYAHAPDHKLVYIQMPPSSKGMAIICDKTTIQWKLSDKCSLYTAETLAILKAIEFTISEINDSNITIFSDSLSALTSLQNLNSLSDIVRKIQNTHYIAKQQDKNITYSWIPGHCNIDGNELADSASKLAHSTPNSITLPIFSLNDLKRVIENDTLLQCQKEWNEKSTKLNEIKRSALPYPSTENISRKHETSLNRLRIGHTHLTHSHLMKKKDPLVCTC